MTNDKSTATLMKAGVGIAALIIVVRIVLEQLGAPQFINNIFGVAWLYFIFPVLFAVRIAAAGDPSPFKSLVKNMVVFGIYTRVMVMITYMLAYVLRWQAPRFTSREGGNVVEGVGFLRGFLVIPLSNAIVWVVVVTLLGMIIGGITLRLKKRPPQPVTS